MSTKFMNPSTMIAALTLLVLALAGCTAEPTPEPITGITWQWASLEETEPASLSVVPHPENYTLLFSEGSLSIKADCNMVAGAYSLDGASLSLAMGPSTLAFCGEESLDNQFLDLLSRVESYSLEGGQLTLQLADGAGSMTFEQGG